MKTRKIQEETIKKVVPGVRMKNDSFSLLGVGKTSCILWSVPSIGAASLKTIAITKLESQMQSPLFVKLEIHSHNAEKKIYMGNQTKSIIAPNKPYNDETRGRGD